MLGGSNSESDFRARRPIVCECGDHAFVATTQGLTTMVSPEDVALLRHRWKAQFAHRNHQVIRSAWNGASNVTLRLSRQILSTRPGFVVDHINCDTTDNRRSNLREATYSENALNRRPELGKAVAAKGVTRRKSGLYQASITRDGKRLGNFRNEGDAAAAYASAAAELHGEFARTE